MSVQEYAQFGQLGVREEHQPCRNGGKDRSKDPTKDLHKIVYTFRTNASCISIELSMTVTPYYKGCQACTGSVEERKTNLKIIREITWSWLVVDTSIGTRLIVIPGARIYLSIGRFGGW
jgi:hypothetical protein